MGEIFQKFSNLREKLDNKTSLLVLYFLGLIFYVKLQNVFSLKSSTQKNTAKHSRHDFSILVTSLSSHFVLLLSSFMS